MSVLIYPMIVIGIIIMVTNIYRYIRFMQNMHDAFPKGKNRSSMWKSVGLALLVFFLMGYICVALFGNPDLMVAGILFGGSIFVAIVLTIMFDLIESIRDNCLSVTEVLIGVIEARDPNLNGHSRFVQNLTMLFYEYLPSDIKKKINRMSLEYAALMHDVGKLGIPEKVLNKPGKLTDEEWVIMKQHPELGVKFLEPLNSFSSIRPWIKYHHERIDGKGYYGLSEQEIPLPSKVIAVTDTYSAIVMRRAYKEPETHETAMNIMHEIAGTQLDASLVEIFCKIPKEKLMACVPSSLYNSGDV
ncbi:MAG: HD domain-containing protein [Treponema sp.]|nr:HD domain-containing protein [Treponema sp.]